ncbi:hypothetical protein MTO96_044597 [Rhipicephalus appendiculatus]
MNTSGNEVFQTKNQLREQLREQEENQLAEERILAYSVIRSRLPESDFLHETVANAYGEEHIIFTCKRNAQLISILNASLDDKQDDWFYLGIAKGRLRPRQWISSEIPSVKGSDSDIYEKVHPSEKYWASYRSFAMEEKNSKVSDEALDYAIFIPHRADTMTAVDFDLAQRRLAQFVYCMLCHYMNPPDVGYDIDDGSAATAFTESSEVSMKIKLPYVGNCALVFWCSDENLITEWYKTLYIVLRLHFVEPQYKMESTNKVDLRSVEDVRVNGKLTVKPKPGILRIYLAVSKEAPKIIAGKYRMRYDSLNVIKLNNLPYEGVRSFMSQRLLQTVTLLQKEEGLPHCLLLQPDKEDYQPVPVAMQLLQMVRLQSFEQRMVLQLLKRRLLMEQLKHRLLVLQLRQRSLLLLVKHHYMLERIRKNRLLFQLLKERMEFQRLLKNHLLELGPGPNSRSLSAQLLIDV